MLFTIMCVVAVIVGALLVILAVALEPARPGLSRRQTWKRASPSPWRLVITGAVVTAFGVAGLFAKLILGWN